MAAASAPRRSARKAKGSGHMRRGEILEAAERIFLAEGFEGATIRRIADEVGVSSTALYMHFPDKSAILSEICDRALVVLLERNRQIAEKTGDPVVRLWEILEAYIRWGLENPNAYQLVYCVPRSASVTWSEGALNLSGRSFDAFRGVVREVAAAGRLNDADANCATRVLWMGCHGLVSMLVSRPEFPWGDMEQLIRTILSGLLRGLVLNPPEDLARRRA